MDELIEQIHKLLDGKQFEEAISQLTAALETAPNARLFYWRGRCNYHWDRDEQARPDFERAIELDPSRAPYHFYLGATLHLSDERALPHYEQAARLDPTYVAARLEAGLCLIIIVGKWHTARLKAKVDGISEPQCEAEEVENMQMSERARDHAEAIVAMDPSEPIGHFILGQALEQLNRSTDSLHAYQRGLEACPDSASLARELGKAYTDLTKSEPSHFDTALCHLNRSLELAGDRLTLAARARLYKIVGQAEKAIADYKAAKTLALDAGEIDVANKLQAAIDRIEG